MEMYKSGNSGLTWGKLANLALCGLLMAWVLIACGDNGPASDILTPAQLSTLAPTFTPVPATIQPNYPTGQYGATNVTAELTGGGSTRLDPAFAQWLPLYKKVAPNLKVNFQTTNSGNGRSALLGTPIPSPASGIKPIVPLDFAGSDVAFKEQELLGIKNSNKSPPVHIPMLLGAVVVAYHLNGFQAELRMSGSTIANIFLGKIKTWNDPQILADNPGLTSLPNKAIIVTIRDRKSSGSGTADTFSRYLATVSPEARDTVGVSSAPNWPDFGQVQGADGATVSKIMSSTDTTIGFLDQEQADAQNLPYVSIRNQGGRYVQPVPATLTAAAQGFPIPDDFRAILINAEGINAYPMVGITYIIVWKDLKDMPAPSLEKAQGLVNFLWWALHDGQNSLSKPFAQLPASLVQRLETLFVGNDSTHQLQYNGKPVLNPTR